MLKIFYNFKDNILKKYRPLIIVKKRKENNKSQFIIQIYLKEITRLNILNPIHINNLDMGINLDSKVYKYRFQDVLI